MAQSNRCQPMRPPHCHKISLFANQTRMKLQQGYVTLERILIFRIVIVCSNVKKKHASQFTRYEQHRAGKMMLPPQFRLTGSMEEEVAYN
jgi:hypothetical protein